MGTGYVRKGMEVSRSVGIQWTAVSVARDRRRWGFMLKHPCEQMRSCLDIEAGSRRVATRHRLDDSLRISRGVGSC